MHVSNIYNQILLKTFLSSPNLRKNTGLVFLTLLYNTHSHKNQKLLPISCDYIQYTISSITRGGSRTAGTSKMVRFLIMVNGWKPLTFITKRSILDGAAALDLPLITRISRSLKIVSTWTQETNWTCKEHFIHILFPGVYDISRRSHNIFDSTLWRWLLAHAFQIHSFVSKCWL